MAKPLKYVYVVTAIAGDPRLSIPLGVWEDGKGAQKYADKYSIDVPGSYVTVDRRPYYA